MKRSQPGRILWVVLLLVGCSGHRPEPLERVIAIQSVLAHQEQSRGLALQATPLTAVRFLKLDAATAPTSMAGAALFSGDRAANGDIAWQGAAPMYDLWDKSAYFVAYHPTGAETSGVKTDWVIDGKTDVLVSDLWSAGRYLQPHSGSGGSPLTFRHVLAQLAVVFKAEAGQDLGRLRAMYGQIKGIKLVQTEPTATYTYSTNKVTFGGAKVDVSLFQTDCQTEFASVDIPESTNNAVFAGGLFAPSTGAFGLIISTDKYSSLPAVAVQLTDGVGGGNKDFEAGKKHVVTLTFVASRAEVVVSEATVMDWVEKHTASSDVNI